MKTKQLFTILMAAATLAFNPCTTLRAEELTDTLQKPASVPATQIQPASGPIKGMTVNGRPATAAEKAMAKQMAKKGTQMAQKGVQMAVSAVTNPAKAEKLGEELEKMGEELEKMGDSLDSMAEDTTFLYEEAETDTALTGSDIDDFIDGFEEGFGEDFGWLHTWWGKLLGGTLGILGGFLGILIALLVVVLLFGLFTSPLWIIALVFWLLIRSGRKPSTTAYVNPPLNPSPTTPAGTPTTDAAPETGDPAAQTAAYSTQPSSFNAQPSTYNYTQPYPDENAEMWKSGIMYLCVGLGLIVLFLSIGADGLWGLGALVGCIGVAKLVISKTSKGKRYSDQPQQMQQTSSTLTQQPQSDEYSKSEN